VKKIAIMTWYQHMNYGTALQATALQKVIKNMGYEVEGINYISHIGHTRKTKLEKILSIYFMKRKLKQIFRQWKYKYSNNDRTDAFVKFYEKYITMSDSAQTSSELYALNNRYDAFVTGSDQIWTPLCFDSKYYLDFVDNPNKMIAYAPSFGVDKIDNKFAQKEIIRLLSRFSSISVRETQGAKIISELIKEKKAEVVLDPTLLLSSTEWEEFRIKRNNSNSEKYILCYFLGEDEKKWRHVKRIAKHLNLTVKVIPVHPKDYYREFTILKGVGPGEFLNLFYESTVVCTDSYHGIIFSIIYEKNFIAYKRFKDSAKDSQNSRVYSLLEQLNLMSRIVSNLKDISLSEKNIDYSKVYELLNIAKNKSLSYLENELKKSSSVEKTGLSHITNTCCGCGVCKTVCNNNAITIDENKNGFFEAEVDKNLCIECGLCRKVCPFNGEKAYEIKRNDSCLYMLRSNLPETLKKSSSGGASHELANYLNNKGYDVYGCEYVKNINSAKHIKINAGKSDQLKRIQGSKYIQSDTRDIYSDILKSKKALITGTPCQIAAIHNFLVLKKRREDFILVELICHGVPSKLLWDKYLKEGSKRYHYGPHPEVYFRNKKKGWMEKYMCLYGNGHKYEKISHKDMFYRFFMLQNCYMSSCYECNYRTRSYADIRIGDYWGNKYIKYKKSGVSMVICLTSKGKEIIKILEEDNRVTIKEEPISDYWNIQYPENPIIPLYYDSLLDDLKEEKYTLSMILKRNCKIDNLNYIMYHKYNYVRTKIRSLIK